MLKFALMFKIILQLFIVSVVMSACSGPSVDYEKQAELQYLDTLALRLQDVKQMLDRVDHEDIMERKEIIEHNYEFLDEKLREKGIVPDAEMMRMIDEYKALEKLYERTDANYNNIVKELEELVIQVKTLKASANSKDYNKETFKIYFKQEKEDVLKLHNLALETLKPCIETESVFMRRQAEVEELATKMK